MYICVHYLGIGNSKEKLYAAHTKNISIDGVYIGK